MNEIITHSNYDVNTLLNEKNIILSNRYQEQEIHYDDRSIEYFDKLNLFLL